MGTKLKHNNRDGFTIVELLIVIVVIAILAAVTIVAYNGIQNRAKATAAQTGASQGAKKAMVYAVQNSDQYPPDIAALELGSSSDTTYQYSVNNATTPRTFCITATNSTISYYVSNSQATPVVGGCPGHSINGVAAITNKALNPSFETNTTGWTNAGSGTTTISRVTTEFYSGTASLLAVSDGTLVNQGAFTATRPTILPNTEYTASVWVKGDVGKVLRLELGEFNSTPTLVSRTSGPNVTGNGTWQRLTSTRTMTAAGDSADLVIRNVAAVANTLYVDAAMLTSGPTLYNYADGNSSNWAWSGAANNTSSTGVPL